MSAHPALDTCLTAARQQLGVLVRALANGDVETLTDVAPGLEALAIRVTASDVAGRVTPLDHQEAEAVHEVRWLLERCRRLAPSGRDPQTPGVAAYQPDGRTRTAAPRPGMLEVKG